MKLTKSLIIVIIGSATLWAQAPANAPGKAPQQKPAAAPAKAAPATQKPSQAATVKKSPTASPATAVAKPVAAKQPTATSKPVPAVTEQKKPAVGNQAPAKPAVTKQAASQPAPGPKKSAVPEKKPAVQAASEAKPAIKEEGPKTLPRPTSLKEAGTSRVSAVAGRRDPFVSPIVRASGPGPVCETGKRCLMVDQIQLKGIVKSPNGFIAVVENPMKRAYFLRENDPVFNGTVVRITGDTVIFREATTDKLGKQSTREIVKKVNAPVV